MADKLPIVLARSARNTNEPSECLLRCGTMSKAPCCQRLRFRKCCSPHFPAVHNQTQKVLFERSIWSTTRSFTTCMHGASNNTARWGIPHTPSDERPINWSPHSHKGVNIQLPFNPNIPLLIWPYMTPSSGSWVPHIWGTVTYRGRGQLKRV